MPHTPLESLSLRMRNKDSKQGQGVHVKQESPLLDDREMDQEDVWDLVPYNVPWGPSYVGYKLGSLPGPEGAALFLRSPTPLRFKRTEQACDRCRERKAKVSGTVFFAIIKGKLIHNVASFLYDCSAVALDLHVQGALQKGKHVCMLQNPGVLDRISTTPLSKSRTTWAFPNMSTRTAVRIAAIRTWHQWATIRAFKSVLLTRRVGAPFHYRFGWVRIQPCTRLLSIRISKEWRTLILFTRLAITTFQHNIPTPG